MGVEIKAGFHPYRLVLYRKAPVKLEINIKNNSDEKTPLISTQIELPQNLSLNKGGLKHGEFKALGELEGNAEKEVYLDVYPNPRTQPGEYPIIVKVLTHYNNDYKYVSNQIVKKIHLKVN